MTYNVGTTDRIIRLIVGILLIVAPFVVPADIWSNALVYWGAIVVGAVLAVTGAVGFCPLYALFGINTRPTVKP